MHIFHKWGTWSEPKDTVYYRPHRMTGEYGQVEGQKQERTCETCGKYQWRAV